MASSSGPRSSMLVIIFFLEVLLFHVTSLTQNVKLKLKANTAYIILSF